VVLKTGDGVREAAWLRFLPRARWATRTSAPAADLKASQPVGRVHALGAPRDVARVGVWPLGPAAGPRRPLGAGHGVLSGWRVHGVERVHSDDYPASVHRHPHESARGWAVAGVRTRSGAATPSSDSVSKPHAGFQNCITPQKWQLSQKSPKNKSCRGAIDLQLSQRVTYVLINEFVWKRVELQEKLGPELLCTGTSSRI
jgi:hypothetical protein